ncbi:MAG: LamG domain-containing protein [Acidobacteriota bacterium]
MPITVLGNPRLIQEPSGQALEFDGSDDGILLPIHPMKGWTRFTLEVIFYPASNGPKEQRFFHVQEDDSENRVLIETRLTGDGRWFLDTYIRSGPTDQTLYADRFLHPTDQWHHAALVFDGKEMSHYVNGQKELSSPIVFTALGPGKTSVGVRMNRVFWYKGAIRLARFTARALAPSEFLKP